MSDDPEARTPTSTEAGDGSETAYRRWSRRKSLARHGAAQDGPEATDAAPAPEAAPAEPAAADAAPARVLTDADMPPLDALDETSDFSPFMSEGVSARLRQAALRKLFSSAVFNRLDGLDDYAEDFTSFEPLGDTVTAEMRYRTEVAAERARARAEREAGEALAEAPGEIPGEVPGEAASEAQGEAQGEAPGAGEASPESDAATADAPDREPAAAARTAVPGGDGEVRDDPDDDAGDDAGDGRPRRA